MLTVFVGQFRQPTFVHAGCDRLQGRIVSGLPPYPCRHAIFLSKAHSRLAGLHYRITRGIDLGDYLPVQACVEIVAPRHRW